MKILFIHSRYSTKYPSGENMVVEAQAKALEEANHDVRVICEETDLLSSKPFFKIKAAFRVLTGYGKSPLNVIEEFIPDIIHVHNLFPNFGTRWITKTEIPIVATLHNFRYYCAQGGFLLKGKACYACINKGSISALTNRCYKKSVLLSMPLAFTTRKRGKYNRILRHADALIILSEHSEKILKENKLISKDLQTYLLPNFYQAPKFYLEPNHSDYWVCAGRISQDKGILDLISLWPSNEKLIILGEGPDKLFAMEQAKNKNIRFKGLVSESQVYGYLKNSKGLVFPSISESALSVVYLQALAAGVPTFAIKDTTVGNDIDKYSTGFTFSNLGELTSFLINGDIGEETLRQISQRYSAISNINWINQIEKIYEELKCMKSIK